MSKLDADRISDLMRRRTLSPEEQEIIRAWLESQPDAARTWEQDRTLTRLLHTLQRPAASSNFTTRVLAAVQRPIPPPYSRNPFDPRTWWRQLHPRPVLAPAFALAAVALGIALVVLQRQHAHQLAMTRSVARVSSVAALLTPAAANNTLAAPAAHSLETGFQLLHDFEVIAKLPTVPRVDTELLAALQ